jgi:hypothetical protein
MVCEPDCSAGFSAAAGLGQDYFMAAGMEDSDLSRAAVDRATHLADAARELAGRFTGDADELVRVQELIGEAEKAALENQELLAWLAGVRAAVWEAWVQVAALEVKRTAWESAVSARRAAVNNTPEDSPARPIRLANLSGDLLELFRLAGDQEILDEAITILTAVITHSQPGQDSYRIRANSLAAAWQMRYELSGDHADIDQSIELLRQAAEDGAGGAVATALLHNLSAAYWRRFKADGDVGDLDLAEEADRRALAGGGGLMAMASLGATLTHKYEIMGGEDNLAEAVSLLSAAATSTSPQAPERPDRLTKLAFAVLDRGEFVTGDHSDMDAAISLLEEALELTPGSAVNHSSRLCNLAGGLRRRAQWYGYEADLDRAITGYEEALGACPPSSADRAGYLSNLANGLRDRYHRSGLLADIDRAIELFVEAAQRPNATGQRAPLMGNLGIAYGERADETQDVETMTAAVDAFREAAALTPTDSPTWVRTRSNLSQALWRRFARTGDRRDLDEALELATAAVAGLGVRRDTHPASVIGPDDMSAAKPGGAVADAETAWNALVVCRSELARLTGRMEDARTAMAAAEAALAHAQPDSPTWAERASNLALIASDYGLAADTQVRRWFADAITAAQASNLPAALYIAGNLASWSEERDDWETAVGAYETALEAMEHLQQRQLSRRDRERWLSAAAGVSARAGLAAIRCAVPEPARGIAMADRGQAVLLAEALSLRSPSGEPADAASLAERGVLVWLCATKRGGVALLLRPQGHAEHVELPQLTTGRVARWLEQLVNVRPGHLAPLLGELWSDVMGPVLDACPGPHRELTLLPVGSARLLPLHAAYPAGPGGQASAVLDLARITYAPNMAALAASERGYSVPADPAAAIGDPDAASALWTAVELTAVTTHFPQARVLERTAATAERAGEILRSASLVHFSCHGVVDRDDPGASRLLLADAPLSVREVRDLTADRPAPTRLVVLSACETALVGRILADEAISLPVALFELGAVGVLGTLWRVAAESTAILMDMFYRHWRAGHASPPDALRRAQQDLRSATNSQLLKRYPDLFAGIAERVPSPQRAFWMSALRYKDPYYWAPFVYLGR